MKRVYICVGIFIFIVTISVSSIFVMRNMNDELVWRINELIEMYEYESESDEIEEKTKEFQQFWDKYYKTISFMTQTNTIDEVAFSVAKLKPLLENNSEDFVAECNSIKYLACLIYNRQIPYFYSIF